MGTMLITFPAADDNFRVQASAAAARAGTPAELQAALRPDFPEVVVHEGIADNRGTTRWYAYRDGSWGSLSRASAAE